MTDRIDYWELKATFDCKCHERYNFTKEKKRERETFVQTISLALASGYSRVLEIVVQGIKSLNFFYQY